MTRIDLDLLTAAASLADGLEADGCSPDEAQRRLATLRETYPSPRLDVVVDTEAFDGRASFDIVIRQDDDVTVSVAVTSGTGLPWPLRGVTRASERHLVRVGTTLLPVAEALATIDFMWDDRSLLLHLVNACIVSAAVDEERVELGPDELQEAVDAFRRAKGLLRAEDTTRWLEQRNLTLGDFRDLVTRSAAAAVLRRRVASGSVDSWFATHRGELTRLVVAWAASGPEADPGSRPTLADEPLAAVLAARRAGRPAGVGEWLAGELPGHLSPLAGSATGTVVSVKVDGLPAEATLLDAIPAVLDAATRAEVERRVFDEWLAERRRETDIEWFWGTAARTSAAA